MNVLETEWWTVAVPPQWWADTEEESILIGDCDDVGCIEISTLHSESGPFDAGQIQAIAEQTADQTLTWRKVTLGDFSGLYGAWTEDDSAVREWYVARGPMLLYITYSCALENSGMDDAAVDELLDTLMPLA
ncbi:MAG: hypothetical protein NXI15_06570 [Gammaproteobacteria bacterium]|jgi:hypothetical protein|nr:hypothetical protein [Gammaproteobacteria bacterium]